MKVSDEKLREHAAFVAQHGAGAWSALRCLEVQEVASVVEEVLTLRATLVGAIESATRDRESLEGEKRLLEAELARLRNE